MRFSGARYRVSRKRDLCLGQNPLIFAGKPLKLTSLATRYTAQVIPNQLKTKLREHGAILAHDVPNRSREVGRPKTVHIPEVVMSVRLGMEIRRGHLPNGSIKIGAVARRFAVSVDLLRLYEREGLLIPIKSPRGTRYFTEADYPWIATILRLVRDTHLHLADIRRVLAALPCWQLRKCGFENKKGCPVISDQSLPCWENRATCPVICAQDCYFCPVYRSAPNCEHFKALLSQVAREAPAAQSAAD